MSAFEVAVVIPARDGLPDVLEAIASARAQTLPPAEIVLADDGSTDGTAAAVAARFGAAVRIVTGPFGSAAAARNAAWRAARAPWIALLDADDVWLPDKLATAAACLARHPAARWFFSDGRFRTLQGDTEASWLARSAALPEDYVGHPVAALLQVNFILTSSVVVRRDALAALGGFDERMSHAEDLELWLRLARRWPAAGSPQALVRYQHREGGLTRDTGRRLDADVALLRRLERDPALPSRLRRIAARRRALEAYRLALHLMRDGQPAAARRALADAWSPARAPAWALTWAATLLPPAWVKAVRGRGGATQRLGGRLVAGPRVVVGDDPPSRDVATTADAPDAPAVPGGREARA